MAAQPSGISISDIIMNITATPRGTCLITIAHGVNAHLANGLTAEAASVQCLAKIKRRPWTRPTPRPTRRPQLSSTTASHSPSTQRTLAPVTQQARVWPGRPPKMAAAIGCFVSRQALAGLATVGPHGQWDEAATDWGLGEYRCSKASRM